MLLELWQVRICGMAMTAILSRDMVVDMAAGLGAAIVIESGRGGVCRTTCLATLHPSETLTTNSSHLQRPCNRDATRAGAALA